MGSNRCVGPREGWEDRLPGLADFFFWGVNADKLLCQKRIVFWKVRVFHEFLPAKAASKWKKEPWFVAGRVRLVGIFRFYIMYKRVQ